MLVCRVFPCSLSLESWNDSSLVLLRFSTSDNLKLYNQMYAIDYHGHTPSCTKFSVNVTLLRFVLFCSLVVIRHSYVSWLFLLLLSYPHKYLSSHLVFIAKTMNFVNHTNW